MMTRIAISFTLLLAVHCFGAEWFVDNAATGSRNGTSWANAWTNLNSVTGTAAGDTIYISGGSTTKTYGDPYWTPPNGTAGNPITIRIGQDSGHNGVATFDGRQINSAWIYGALKNVVIDGSYNGSTNFVSTNCLATGYSVWCDGAASLSVNYVRTYNSWKFAPGTNIVIDLCYIKPPPPNTPGTLLPDYCISFNVRGLADTGYTNNQISRTTFITPVSDDFPAWGSDCIQGGRSAMVWSNYFGTYAVTNDTEWQHTDGWQPSGTDNSNVRAYANTFENIANYSIYWECTGSTTNVWLYNNVFRMTNSASAFQPCVGIVFAFQGVSSQTFSNNLVANNTFFDYYGYTAASFGSTNLDNTYLGCVFANNLAINSGAVASTVFAVGDGAPPNTNGIWIAGNKGIPLGSGNTNISLAQMALVSGVTNIGFVSPFITLSGNNDGRISSADTAARDLAVDLSAWFTTDADGNTRAGAWDIGAYEYIAPASTYRGFSFGSGVRLIGAGSVRQ